MDDILEMIEIFWRQEVSVREGTAFVTLHSMSALPQHLIQIKRKTIKNINK